MSFNFRITAAAAAILLATPVFADGIRVEDPYARVSAKMSTSGAAFMIIHNESGQVDHLIGAKSTVSKKTELHTHMEDANGVMKMLHVDDGFELPAGGTIEMKRGGHHVMFLGLNEPLSHGDTVSVTLVFEKAGELSIDVPVDLERKPMHGHMNHGTKNEHGQMQEQTN